MLFTYFKRAAPAFRAAQEIRRSRNAIRGSVPRVTDLIIFDCDGVLVDSERIAIAANIATLAEWGHTATEAEIVEHFVGKSAAPSCASRADWLGERVPPRGRSGSASSTTASWRSRSARSTG